MDGAGAPAFLAGAAAGLAAAFLASAGAVAGLAAAFLAPAGAGAAAQEHARLKEREFMMSISDNPGLIRYSVSAAGLAAAFLATARTGAAAHAHAHLQNESHIAPLPAPLG